MRRLPYRVPVWRKPLNTLGQTGTSNTEIKPAIVIKGDGSELGNDKAIKSKAKRKLISQKLAKSMMIIAEKEENLQRKKSYRNTYYCQSKIYSFEGRTYGNYCKNRFCTLCSAIRKAEIINKYRPVLSEWKHPYFVTLTVKSVSSGRLRNELKKVLNVFQQIIQKYRKRSQRGTGRKFKGIKSLECNFNPVERTYNPHIHIIVEDKETADILIAEWLARWPKKQALRKCQDSRPVRDMERDLIETIKYGSKIFTEPDVNRKAYRTGNRDIYAKALYNIFEAMDGLRIFDRFGFDLPYSHKICTPARVVDDAREWKFLPQYSDWITDNELTLSGYCPPKELVNLLEYNIDTGLG